jgi:hypothetical protein
VIETRNDSGCSEGISHKKGESGYGEIKGDAAYLKKVIES